MKENGETKEKNGTPVLSAEDEAILSAVKGMPKETEVSPGKTSCTKAKNSAPDIDPCAGCSLNCGGKFKAGTSGEFANDPNGEPIYKVLFVLLAALLAGGLLSSFVLNALFH